MKKLFFIIFLTQSISVSFASHDHSVNSGTWKRKFETVWKENGTTVSLRRIAEVHQFDPKSLNLFIFIHRVEINNDREAFFKQAFSGSDTTDQNAGMLDRKMLANSAKYDQWAKTFKKQQELKSDSFQTWEKSYKAFYPSVMATTTVPMCENVNFEYSGNPYFNWVMSEGNACDFDYSSPFLCNLFSTITPPTSRIAVETAGYDPTIGGTVLSKIASTGTYSLRLENYSSGAMASMASLSFVVDPDKPYYQAKYAIVLEDPGNDHPLKSKPYFWFRIKDNLGNIISCANYLVFANTDAKEEDPSFSADFISIPGTAIKYRPWTSNVIPLHDYVNQTVTVEYVVADCPWGGHMGYAYIDGDCLNGSITIGDCQADGTREITAPDFFNWYQWRGPGIIGSNTDKTVKTNSFGKFKILMSTNSYCRCAEVVTVAECTGPTPEPPCNISATVTSVGSCNSNNNLYSVNLNLSLTDVEDDKIIKLTVDNVVKDIFGPFTGTMSVTIPNLYSDGGMHSIKIQEFDSRFTTDEMAECTYTVTYTAPTACWSPELACENCIGSFAPVPNQTYVVSLWVKDIDATATTTTYTDPFAEVICSTPGGPVSTGQILGSGRIIEGWQRIYYEFTIPATATNITLKLGSNTGTSDFDDIRIYPLKGSMKSYVYDPISLKLVAVLDENNYATLYEYDQEGSLIRTKKETERGVVTISENRQNNPKK